MFLRDFQRRQSFGCRMGAAEEAERLIVKALQAERQAVHPGRSKVGEPRRLDRVGIGFEGDLDVLGRAPMLTDRFDQGRHGRGLHQRRSPAAEKDRGQLSAGKEPCLVRKVGEQSLAPRVLIDLRPNMAVEIAIGAFGNAKRPMDVEGERFRGLLKVHKVQSLTRARSRLRARSGGNR